MSRPKPGCEGSPRREFPSGALALRGPGSADQLTMVRPVNGAPEDAAGAGSVEWIDSHDPVITTALH